MTQDYTTVRIPIDDAEQAREEKDKTGETWGEYLRRCAANPPEERQYVAVDELEARLERLVDDVPTADRGPAPDVDVDVDADAVADAVAEQVDTPDTVSLDASERQRIAQAVAEVLR